MAIQKVPCFVQLRQSTIAGKRTVTIDKASSYAIADVPANAMVFYFEIEVDDEWIKPAIQTGITLRLDAAGLIDPQAAVAGLKRIREERTPGG